MQVTTTPHTANPAALAKYAGERRPWYAVRWPCRAAARLTCRFAFSQVRQCSGMSGRRCASPPVRSTYAGHLACPRRGVPRCPRRPRAGIRPSRLRRAGRWVQMTFWCPPSRWGTGPGAAVEAIAPGPGAYGVLISPRRYACTWLALCWPRCSPERIARMPGTCPASRSAANSSAAACPWPFSSAGTAGTPSGTADAQQVRERGAEPEHHHRHARHEHDYWPRCPVRSGGGQQVVDDLAEHAERQGTDRRPAGERAGPLRRARCQPRAERIRAVRLDADRERDRRVQVEAAADTGQQVERGRTRTCRRGRPTRTRRRTRPGRRSGTAASAAAGAGHHSVSWSASAWRWRSACCSASALTCRA